MGVHVAAPLANPHFLRCFSAFNHPHLGRFVYNVKRAKMDNLDEETLKPSFLELLKMSGLISLT